MASAIKEEITQVIVLESKLARDSNIGTDMAYRESILKYWDKKIHME